MKSQNIFIQSLHVDLIRLLYFFGTLPAIFEDYFTKNKNLHNYHKYTWSAFNIKFYHVVVNFLLQLIYNFLFFLCMAMYAKNKRKNNIYAEIQN